MVLGEVVNLPGRWSSYPPHGHPQPEVYLYYFEKPMGFGASWVNGEVHEVHHHGASIITEGTHQQVMAPGYACCYTWGIRHLDGNRGKKDKNRRSCPRMVTGRSSVLRQRRRLSLPCVA